MFSSGVTGDGRKPSERTEAEKDPVAGLTLSGFTRKSCEPSSELLEVWAAPAADLDVDPPACEPDEVKVGDEA
eukprot:CAMPEP_0194770742 /NCGR_PEP_ID=MMETSP0323_2-20130528/47085_1 /TAXON_ID=2866 ORGANISM="Crypthecodinium cohnii, Strain Seligo" /NCGR_SAMPLE_ID=MMETSP0323_2 /ASSEMBLY_ACC=CAM_ASM_000346 /LENGTH=72 /DNA_ID=CAMNT_0039704447 /DNA_START=173 /DNA_END=387 /DNA_ORIENTATION=+